MFGQHKPLASLSSTLLARKGTARPAMRPQGFGGFGAPPGPHDDLGWNDMGHPDMRDPDNSPPEQAYAPPVAPPMAGPVLVPPVLRQREVLQEEFAVPKAYEPSHEQEGEVEPEAQLEPAQEPAQAIKPISIATARRIARETHAKHAKAAFTLRLDHERHLRLRLASALHNVSAQVLVTEALDHFLQSQHEVEELARQLPSRAGR